ncbi:MAG TPA: hypothetical protein VGB93_00425, partial [Methylovirgula sp.]
MLRDAADLRRFMLSRSETTISERSGKPPETDREEVPWHSGASRSLFRGHKNAEAASIFSRQAYESTDKISFRSRVRMAAKALQAQLLDIFGRA